MGSSKLFCLFQIWEEWKFHNIGISFLGIEQLKFSGEEFCQHILDDRENCGRDITERMKLLSMVCDLYERACSGTWHFL